MDSGWRADTWIADPPVQDELRHDCQQSRHNFPAHTMILLDPVCDHLMQIPEHELQGFALVQPARCSSAVRKGLARFISHENKNQ